MRGHSYAHCYAWRPEFLESVYETTMRVHHTPQEKGWRSEDHVLLYCLSFIFVPFETIDQYLVDPEDASEEETKEEQPDEQGSIEEVAGDLVLVSCECMWYQRLQSAIENDGRSVHAQINEEV